jgi:periplasmic divalent cation tolerance protein
LVAGKIEKAAEVLLVLKTTRPRLKALEKLILRKHPYDTPEILVLPLDRGTGRYLAWLQKSVRQPGDLIVPTRDRSPA